MANEVCDDVEALVEKYLIIYRGYEELETTDQLSNSKQYQTKLAQLIHDTESLVHSVNKHNIFGTNESVEELPADHLRYILLPALLGYFTSRETFVDTAELSAGSLRQDCIKRAKSYYTDFMGLCKSYGIESASHYKNEDDAKAKHHEKDAIARKSEKVKRYKAKKALESQLRDLFTKLRLDHVDESTKREYYMKLTDNWVLTVEEELTFIEEELEILKHMSKLREGSSGDLPPSSLKPKPSRPFILTKNDMQKQVFGLGYPSVPTYTVEEFYEAQMRAGQIPAPGSGGVQGAEAEAAAAERQEIVKEYKVEKDDEETLIKAREWDDWKDDHRRGWGNRQNMG
ncbi:immunoglobulin-binding protein 1-like [Watersipora subatra]|uniref:immunoglobulin-binding protein 1-like n=1 Tax=Watersipora subatra TaxID=2589382 RepID=UPI00355BD4B8